jgi:sugar/nucleoside kinase (ribokinase family)
MKNKQSEYNKIHCLGGALADLIVSPIKSYPEPKLNTSIFVDNLSYSPGGGAVNSSQALAKLGLEVSVFSKVGNDPFGHMIVKSLSDNGIDITNILVSEKGHTSTVIVGVHEDADRSFISYHGSLSEYSNSDLTVETLLDCSYLLYSDLFNLPLIDGKPLAIILNRAQQQGVTTLLDATWGISGLSPDIFEEVLPYVDYLLPSADECRLMYPGKSDEKLIELFLKKGAQAVILKRGSQGVIGSDGSKTYKLPALKKDQEIVDTIGAGDSFNAGFLYGLVQGYNFSDCIKAGSVVAGCSLMGTGAWYSGDDLKQELSIAFKE